MTKNRAGGLIFLFAGMYGLFFSVSLPMGKWNEPGAGVFPLSLSVLLCASGILMVIHKKQKEKMKMDWSGVVKGLLTPLRIIGLTAAFILFLNRVGYFVTASLYVFLLLFWVSRYRLWMAVSLAIIIGLGSWYIFGKLFAVPLPKGLWIL